MVTRGLKATPYQNPNATIGKPTVVIIPEYKELLPERRKSGIRIFTCHVRRSAPDAQDPMLNTHSKHNCIAACIQVRPTIIVVTSSALKASGPFGIKLRSSKI
jgi:hypothetical protein